MDILKIVIKNGMSSHVKIHHYPDGQKNVTLDMEYFNNVKFPIEIICSIRNFSELEVLICIVRALQKNDFTIISINFVYLFGMRSDRAFEKGMPNYFKDVLSPIINGLNIRKIIFFHPHNAISLYDIKNHFIEMPEDRFYPISFIKLYHSSYKIGGDQSSGNIFTGLDALFMKERIHNDIKMILKRENIDEISKHHGEILIIDDLCDGGLTFINAAKYLKNIFPHKSINLYVTHALFTNGIDIIANHFSKIICTNSYQDIDHPMVSQIKVI